MTGHRPQAARDEVARYDLARSPLTDQTHLALVRELALLGAPANADMARRYCRTVARLVDFHQRQGLPVHRATLLDPDVVSRHLTALTKTLGAQVVRSDAVALRRISLADGPPGTRREPPRPDDHYSPGDVQRLADWAGGVADPHVRHGLLGILTFGLGAGLTWRDLAGLDGPDIAPSGPGGAVLVDVRAPTRPGRRRTVPLLEPYERLGRELAAASGDGWALRPAGAPDTTRSWQKIVFAGHPDPRLPDLNVLRCRRTWLHVQLEGGTPVKPLLRAAALFGPGALVVPTGRLGRLTAADRDTELRGR